MAAVTGRHGQRLGRLLHRVLSSHNPLRRVALDPFMPLSCSNLIDGRHSWRARQEPCREPCKLREFGGGEYQEHEERTLR